MENFQLDRDKLKLSDNFDNDSISLTELMFSFARQIKLILIVPLAFCMLSIVYLLIFINPIYISTSKIMSSSNSGSANQAIGLAAQFGINLPTGQQGPKWVYPEILTSRTLAKAVLKQKFDTIEFGSQKTLLHILTYENKNLGLDSTTLEIIGVNKLLEMIDVSENVKTSILTLSISSFEPILAAKINDALIGELDTHQRKYNKAKASEAKNFIEERITETEKELILAEEQLKVFKDRNRRIENSPALQLELQRLDREVRVLTGVFTTLKQQLETTKIEEVKESDYVIILDPPETPIKYSKPNRRLMVLMAGFFGLGVALFFAFLRESASKIGKQEKKQLLKAQSLLWNNIVELIFGKKA